MGVLDQWLLKLDPNQAPLTILVFAIVASAIVFFRGSWWPWFTKDFWPARRDLQKVRIEAEFAAERERNSTQRGIEAALVKISVMLDKQDERFEAHDAWTRAWAQQSSNHAGLNFTMPVPSKSTPTLASSMTDKPKGGEG